jgi:hypothetical protein
MPNMSDQELLSIISNAESQAVIYNGEFSRINERLLKDYLQDPYGDEVADQSQVISPDVQDVVESDMPSLARVFLGSSQPVVFEPRSNNEDEIKEVEEKNKYVNYLIMNKPDSYQTLFNWMKDAEIQKNGVLKYFIEDSRKTEEVSYSGVNEDELQQIVLDLQRDQVKKIEVASSSEDEFGSFDITFKVTRGSQELKIINVPNEQFLISKNASTLDNAELVGDKVNNKTRGQLLSEGIDRELINQLPRVSVQRDNNSTLKNIRNRDTGQSVEGEEINDWANELVEITDLYVMVDYDQDGVAERRHILKSGNHILINEAFDHVPYASLSCLLMPHKAIGRSRAELTQQTQRVKTVLMRQTLDNMYAVNRPRNVLHPDVNIDDYLQMRPNGAVRLKSKTQVNPANAVVPLVVPPMMQQSLQVVQYMDSVRAQSTGTYLASQGLDADSIAKETATRFMGVQEKGDEKIELVARTMAETGWRKLYEGVAWMVSHFQDEETEIFVLGESLKVNPSGWRYEHFVSSKVGLGAGSPEKMVESMQGILGIQQQLQAAGSPMVDQVKLYNTLDDIIKGLGLKQTDQFFNNPEKPEQLLLAENEILKAQLLQTQQLLEQSQNPLAEAETIKAQARLIEAQGKGGLEAAKIAENARQFNIKTAQDAKQHQDDLVFDLTKLEVDSGVNIQGANV